MVMSACRARSRGGAVTHSVRNSNLFLFWVLRSTAALSWAKSLIFLVLPLSLSSSVSLESLESLICWYRLLLLFDFFFTGISVVPSCSFLLFLFGVLVSVSLFSSVSIVALVLRFRFCWCTLGSGRFACSLATVSLCCPGVSLFLCFALFSLSLSLICLCRFLFIIVVLLLGVGLHW